MEPKKNPAKDTARKSPLFFAIGLGIGTALVLMAFEWRTTKMAPPPRHHEAIKDEALVVRQVYVAEATPPAKIPAPSKRSAPGINANIIETKTGETDQPLEPMIDLGQDGTGSIDFGTLEIPADTLEIVTAFPEKQAEPVGGYQAFYKQLQKTLVYPKRAKQLSVEGKVFVEFIVNRDGRPSDVKVLRGIGAGCDEEAVRAIALTQWHPGKQRGKPVRVKMVLPIQFRLD
ncbi:MAG: energy transducer TonB [Cyclobacteriaceae bacterium]|jgi:protein TonB|nr:energy transducer TonB [Cyclobacteriaceae bacterium]